MKLNLKIDYDGNPYIECSCTEESNNDALMQIFIRKAREEGLTLKDGEYTDLLDYYMTIRLKKSHEGNK